MSFVGAMLLIVILCNTGLKPLRNGSVFWILAFSFALSIENPVFE